LNGSAGFLLDDHAAFPKHTACEQIANPKGYDIAASQFAVQGHVEQSQITEAALNLQSDTDAPNMHWSERKFSAGLGGR
jgi:hypothetical protein